MSNSSFNFQKSFVHLVLVVVLVQCFHPTKSVSFFYSYRMFENYQKTVAFNPFYNFASEARLKTRKIVYAKWGEFW